MKVIAALVLVVTLMASEPKMMQKIDATIDRSYRYESDPYDVWQSYEMTKRRKAGDCEDFAIAKYRIAVDKFGMNKEDFKFIIVNIPHMVLEYKGTRYNEFGYTKYTDLIVLDTEYVEHRIEEDKNKLGKEIK